MFGEVGKIGKIIAIGRSLIQTTAGITTSSLRPLVGTEMTFDTTLQHDINITYKWTTASTDNILNIEQIEAEHFRK